MTKQTKTNMNKASQAWGFYICMMKTWNFGLFEKRKKNCSDRIENKFIYLKCKW